MSTPTAAQVAAQFEELLMILNGSFISSCCELSICAVILYEHLVTFGTEYDLVWGRKLTGPNVIFFINRYALFVWSIVNILGLFSWESARRYNFFWQCAEAFVMQLMVYTIWAVFSGLRVYAVSSRNWYFTVPTVALGMVPVAANIYSLAKTSYAFVVVLPVLGHICQNTSYLTSDFAILTIASDVIVLCVTWFNTYTIKRDADNANIKATIVTLLLRDGTFYFLCLLCLNIIAIVLDARTPYVYILYFVAPISSMLISRFLLNLRHIYYATGSSAGSGDPSGPSTGTFMSDMQFAGAASPYIGNMGAPLSHGTFMLSGGSVSESIDDDKVVVPLELAQADSAGTVGTLSNDLENTDVYKAVWQVSKDPLRVGIIPPRDEMELGRLADKGDRQV
ncbi:hypothetical protein SCP_0509510 [Sparassis crispa]|uniref:DUF6533 domain-containing protein n=1 Tax=Sparassis crispa TaxID=139825 RepID=A0A401GQ62_9APHY|nr:hypothetical protein SCP_0509510 [Sparassis crispa]GBE83894.1 hypothetical protein SCP_0509510 [Sparassis crispa]